MMRVVAWFSCGAASAVTAKLCLQQNENVVIAYCDTKSEHPDNDRFLAECENWYGQEIVRLSSPDYQDIWDVFEKTRWLVGPAGARCTAELKKKLRKRFEQPDDLQAFGYTLEEINRAERFRANNPDVKLVTPLIDAGLTKANCLGILADHGIDIPEMYRLGFNNNNCIGCVKGQAGYWNKIRRHFPDTFRRMADMERKIGAAINKSYAGDGQRKAVFLDELDENAGLDVKEPAIDCDLLCGAVSADLKGD